MTTWAKNQPEPEKRIAVLPKAEDIVRLNANEREEVLARLMREKRRRKIANLEASTSLPDPVDWMEANCYDIQKVNLVNPIYDESKLIRFEDFQKRIIRKVLTVDPKTGRFPYRTIVYSCPKKSGKTTVGMCVATYFARCVEAPNAVYILANDREQSAGRAFAFSIPTLLKLGARKESKFAYVLPNGTIVQALTSDPDKEAGGSYGLTIFDELWAYTSARSRLLFDELKPILTRKNSIRLITTYAGFEDASDLLMQIYKTIFTSTEETELAPGARVVEGLEDIVTQDAKGDWIPACYEAPREGLFYFNDHEQRMPWQAGGIDEEVDAFSTQANVYRHKHNRWQVTENPFVDPTLIRAAVKNIILPRAGIFAIDASMKHDCTAIVGVNEVLMRYVTMYAKAWKPDADGIDLDETVVKTILELYKAGQIERRAPLAGEKALIVEEKLTPIAVWYDTFQMHQVAMTLRKKHRLLLAPFQQGTERVLADTFLQKQYLGFNIDIPNDFTLISHLEAAKAETQTDKDDENRIRIVKATGTHAKAIDLAVAQSMAVWACSKRPRRASLAGISQAVTKGW